MASTSSSDGLPLSHRPDAGAVREGTEGSEPVLGRTKGGAWIIPEPASNALSRRSTLV